MATERVVVDDGPEHYLELFVIVILGSADKFKRPLVHAIKFVVADALGWNELGSRHERLGRECSLGSKRPRCLNELESCVKITTA